MLVGIAPEGETDLSVEKTREMVSISKTAPNGNGFFVECSTLSKTGGVRELLSQEHLLRRKDTIPIEQAVKIGFRDTKVISHLLHRFETEEVIVL